MNFVSLHNHSEFSALDGFSRFNDIVDDNGDVLVQGMTSRLVELGQTKCALTDHGTLSGIYPAYESFKKQGIQLLPGIEFYVVDDMTVEKGFQYHLVVIAKNKNGWENLLKLNYLGFEKGSRMVFDRQIARIDLKLLSKYKEDLLVCSACLAGIPAQGIIKGNISLAEDHIKKMAQMFPESYYLEIQPIEYYHRLDYGSKVPEVDKQWIQLQADDQKAANDKIIDLSEKLKVPVVVTLDSHYVLPEHRETHLLMLAIQSKTNIYQPSFSISGPGGRLAFEATPMLAVDEITRVLTETASGFNSYPDYMVKQWIQNTIRAADQCSPADYLEPSGYKIPLFPIEDSADYKHFLKWKDGMDQEQIDRILNDSSDYLKTRLER